MEQKISKIFGYFGNIKNEPFYSSCIVQIIEIYEGNSESLKFILYNLNHLIFSNCKQVRVRLKHRLICASIISKLNKIYVERVKRFIFEKQNVELENFQLDNQPIKHEQKSIQNWEELDLLKIIQSEDLLHATSKGKGESLSTDNLEEQKKVFDEFLDMNHATMLNIQNAFKDVDTQNDITDEAIKKQKLKYQIKVEKINTKNKQKIQQIELNISNPFNLMYEICVGNLLNTEWQLRHLAVLILKQLLLHSQFLGFSQKVSLNKIDTVQKRFEFLSNVTKDLLIKHIEQGTKRKSMTEEIIYKSLILLSLDRFADYQTDQSLIIVRMIGAEILSICFKTLVPDRQIKMIKMIKKLFDKESPFGKTKFTWQVKHSFLYFLNTLLDSDQSYGKILCNYLQQSLIKMLGNDQIDEITLCICKIIQKFIKQPYFNNEKQERINRQIWAIVQNLDDISISARDTLKLLLELFPFFKLNEGACIQRLKKFFTSKISEVRVQLYKLMGSLYSKKKEITDPKIVQRNLILFLQASIIQYQTQNFNNILLAVPHIIPYIVKFKNMRKIVEFINTSVTPNQYTEEIITNKFLIMTQKQKSQYSSNQYLYIYEHENVHCPISVFTDKRIWKISLVLIQCFRTNFDGFEELLKGIQKNNQKNYRAKILIFLVLAELIKCHKKSKIFDDYKDAATKFLSLEISDILDNQIIKFFIPQLQNTFKEITESHDKLEAQIQNDVKNKQAISSIKQIYEGLKKNDFCLKTEVEIGKKLNVMYNSEINPLILANIELILKIIDNIMKIQRQLLKNIKIVCVYYLIRYNEPGEVTNLNLVIKSIMDSIKQDNYKFIGQIAAKSALGLSLSLVKNKKVVYQKFNSNLCTHISTNYNPTTYKLQQHEKSMKLQGQYMESMCKYIEMIGKAHPDYLKESWKYYLQENIKQVDGKKSSIEEQYNRLLTLLSGTITTLLKIDNQIIEEKEFFVHKFTKKVSLILKNCINTAFEDTISIKLTKILIDSIIYLSQNYTQISNVFFEWFLEEMDKEILIFYNVLQKLCLDYITKIASISSIFILQIVKSITKVALHDKSMNSLSNLILGVYTNTTNNQYSPKLIKASEQGIQFIKNFKDASNFNYKIMVQLKAQIQLRNYQIQGISWLGFLTKYNLNGALCDDMGLGKTLQVLILIQNEYKKSIEKKQCSNMHSLIVCPTTLMEHWAFEYYKYFKQALCRVIIIDNKKKLIEIDSQNNQLGPILYITNYSLLQKQEISFQKTHFKFIILDEGHIIKNIRTNKFKAVKKLKGLHRFLLTGTPIQNRLIELWGLFDFLMPGYLYTEEVFKKNYEKLFQVNLTSFHTDQLLFSDHQKKTLQKLHFKVMPFIMRRMKCDVLRELPQKIINDYYCTLTECQIKHYEKLEERIKDQNRKKQINVLTNLHEMIKIVNHPYLTQMQNNLKWDDSGKFIALAQLFEQFGFNDDDTILQNKVIIFSKQKATIDLICQFLADKYPSINYLKLTSDVKIGERFTVAQVFNGDSDIKILLVTKAIGGQGLNLSSANFVIMFDSDYNPTVDMQAIDRAHRIGQKRVLNVYRLITKDTLEQKIMGIQKFKTNLANAIVNIDNASIKNIKQSKLPQLLENVRDLQSISKDHEVKINNSIYSSLVQEMERNAIDTDEFNKKY